MFLPTRKWPANDGNALASVIFDNRRQLILGIVSTRARIGRVKEGNFTYAPLRNSATGIHAAHSKAGPIGQGTNTLGG